MSDHMENKQPVQGNRARKLPEPKRPGNPPLRLSWVKREFTTADVQIVSGDKPELFIERVQEGVYTPTAFMFVDTYGRVVGKILGRMQSPPSYGEFMREPEREGGNGE
jgi:hypothetical protein